MYKSLSKKLCAGLLAGCTVVAFSGAALAAPSDNANNAPPSRVECFERGVLDGPADRIDRRAVRQYQEEFTSSYSWMYADTRRSAARSFAAVDNALNDNKISQQQADKLKKQLISFYKNKQKHEDSMRKLDTKDAREYRADNREYFSLRANMDKLSEKTGIAEDTLKDILRPQPSRHHFLPQRPRQQLMDGMDQIRQKMLNEGKITQPEMDAIKNYMDSMHDKYVQMNEDQKDNFIREFRQMNDEQRLAKMAEGTGISTDRLQQIFQAFKDEVQQDLK